METKRIVRSRQERIIAGVAGGLASYWNVDPLYIRLAFVLLSFVQGMGVVLYFVLWLLLPNQESLVYDARTQVRENVDEMRSTAENAVERLRGAFNQHNQGPLN